MSLEAVFTQGNALAAAAGISNPNGVLLPQGSAAIVSTIRQGNDLIVTLADGSTIIVDGFFVGAQSELYAYNPESGELELFTLSRDGNLTSTQQIFQADFEQVVESGSLEARLSTQGIEAGAAGLGGLAPATIGAIAVGGVGLTAAVTTNRSGPTSVEADTTPPAAVTSVTLAEDTGLSDEDGVSSNGLVNVEGITEDFWEYSVDGGQTFTRGTGTSFTLAEGDYTLDPEVLSVGGKIQVRQTDTAGNVSEVTEVASGYRIDTTNPDPIDTITLVSDTGLSDVDGITTDGKISIVGGVTVFALPGLALPGGRPSTDAYLHISTDGGATFTQVSDSLYHSLLPGVKAPAAEIRLELEIGTYEIGAIQVQRFDTAGNSSDIVSNTQVFEVVEAPPAAVTSITLTTDNGVSSEDGVGSVGLMSVAGITENSWEYSYDGGVNFHTGTGSEFVVPTGSYSSGQVQVRQISGTGMLGPITQSSSAYTIDPAEGDLDRVSADSITFKGMISPADVTDESNSTTGYGGLSGLDYDRTTGKWVVASDSTVAPRLIEMDGKATSGQSDFDWDGVTDTVIDISTGVRLDLESVRVWSTADSTSYFVTSEGGNDSIQPRILEVDGDGTILTDFTIPSEFQFSDADPSQGALSGRNVTFEGMSLSPDGDHLLASFELPTEQDGVEPTLTTGGSNRILSFDRETGAYEGSFLYPTDPIFLAENQIAFPPTTTLESFNGITEILHVDNDTILVLERAYVKGTGYGVRVYQVDIPDTLTGDQPEMVTKELIIDLEQNWLLGVVPSVTLNGSTLDDASLLLNIEGMAWGPSTATGRSLVLMTDNDFRPELELQLWEFEVPTVSISADASRSAAAMTTSAPDADQVWTYDIADNAASGDIAFANEDSEYELTLEDVTGLNISSLTLASTGATTLTISDAVLAELNDNNGGTNIQINGDENDVVNLGDGIEASGELVSNGDLDYAEYIGSSGVFLIDTAVEVI